jgi:accessory colonization factor AcfC
MKKIIFVSFILLPFLSKAQFTITNSSTTSLLQVREGVWPMELQRIIKETDTCYVLEFRDQQYTDVVNMSSLRFGNMLQLRYFMQGLAALKKGNTGDIAKFKDYTIKRIDLKGMKGTSGTGVWYTLAINGGESTNFQQSDADKMIAQIRTL